MSKVKMICNPYKKENLFQTYDDETQAWININYENNPNSKLLSDPLHKGFFPFIADKAVNEIINEYGIDNEPIELYFEGTQDDFHELQQVCSLLDNKQEIILYQEETYLNDANVVLSEIIQVFTSLRPIISDSESHQEEIEYYLNQFLDITNDIVPLCVMGNYSAGKSTFINALIGNEILPSGDEPLTAKIFKIVQADHDHIACIKFADNDMMILFNETGYEFIGEDKLDPLAQSIKKALDEMKDSSMIAKVNQTLSLINHDEGEDASKLIEITIPFKGPIWNQSKARFVILDTPGSNSASNDEHLVVLEQALSGLTNGLAIYVSEYDSLDSKDNKELYDKLKKIKELDHRFSFIIVNKADENDLPIEGYFSKEKEDEILHYTVPKNLYTEGIFFVSSVLGLGAKTNGSFLNKHLNKVYRKTKFLFDDIEDEDYTILYRYNIMPKQLKEASLQAAQEAEEDLVYVNSGLYTVEQEINNFANQYASYNKCKQSTIYLDHIMDIISKEIDEIITKREQIKEEMKHALEKDKAELSHKINQTSEDTSEVMMDAYSDLMYHLQEKYTPQFTYEHIKKLEDQYINEQKELMNYSNQDDEVKGSMESLKSNLKEGMNDVLKGNFKNIINIGKNFIDDAKDTLDDYGKLKDTQKEVNKEASKRLLDQVKKEYSTLAQEAQEQIDYLSKDYWTNKCIEFKELLSRIITGSTALSDDNRTELSQIIMMYRNIYFDQSKHNTFKLEDFEQKIKFGEFVIYESNKLNIRKMINSYNQTFATFMDEVENTIYRSHRRTFQFWLEKLLLIIDQNIVRYSPELSEKQFEIEAETNKITDLQNRQEQIKEGKKHIDHMMNWR